MNSQQHIIGSAVYRVYSIGSTNTELLQNAERYEHGAVLTAACQTAGRGRYRRSWHSQKGGLYLSILLKHIDPSGTLLPFCLLSALAVVRTLRTHVPAPLFVKWPNDVYAGNRKLCGILPEAVTRGKDTHGVIGIGMNINNPIPSALRDQAVSMKELTGGDCDTGKLFESLIRQLDGLYQALSSGGFAAFLPELNALLYGKGRVRPLNVHGEARDVVPLAFTERAGLLCRENGEEKELLFGEL